MCLFVKEGCKPEIAKKDIVCYKFVDDWGRYWKPCILVNNVKYSYPYNKVLTAESYSDNELRPINHLEIKYSVPFGRTIEEGFHADCKKTHYSIPCIIPKGTEYCLGNDNEIVAVNMIVFRSVLGYCWYRIKKLWQE